MPRRGSRAADAPVLLLIALMLGSTVWFSAYAIARHDAQLTHRADLGQMDIAIWNTAHGRFVEQIKDETVTTRLTDHAELIFAPVSLVFWLWDDVRGLPLVLQAAALAIGALPIYLIARRRMLLTGYGGSAAGWAGLVFGAAYLLMPVVQAPAAAEFHALPLAAPLIAWAFWAVETRRWAHFVVASLLLAGVQEGTALLAAALGACGALRALFGNRSAPETGPDAQVEDLTVPPSRRWPGIVAGVLVLIAGIGWFYAATFVIIPRFAAVAYGTSATPYAARYGPLGDSFAGVLKSFVTQPAVVWQILVEPLRLQYLAGLLLPGAFLALLAPEIIALSLPLLLANVLSSYPFQYSGELHYSAPLAPYFAIAAVVGLARLVSAIMGVRGRAMSDPGLRAATTARPRVPSVALLGATLILMLAGALWQQSRAGYTPGGREYWRTAPGGWPQPGPHERLLARFVSQAPAGEPGSTTAALYPHLSHRERLYQFPNLGDATWALVDVSGVTDRHPAVIRDRLLEMLSAGWGVADAADGYALLVRGRGMSELPDEFYNFARTGERFAQHPLDVEFGNGVRLVGYDVVDDPKWRRTSLRFYLQATRVVPRGTAVTIDVAAPDGALAIDHAQTTLPALLWHPPEKWQPGETVVAEVAPAHLPRVWAPVVGLEQEGQTVGVSSSAGLPAGTVLPDGRVRLAAWERQPESLVAFEAPWRTIATGVDFRAPGWPVSLDLVSAPQAAAPGDMLDVYLWWGSSRRAERDYTIFLHLLDAGGRQVGGADSGPIWFGSLPTTAWTLPDGVPFGTWTAHRVPVPPDLPPGRYSLTAGWYDWSTGERLRVVNAGNGQDDEHVIGEVEINKGAAREPDLCCLLEGPCCASQP